MDTAQEEAALTALADPLEWKQGTLRGWEETQEVTDGISYTVRPDYNAEGLPEQFHCILFDESTYPNYGPMQVSAKNAKLACTHHHATGVWPDA